MLEQISNQQQREDLKNRMVTTREMGNYEESIEGFNGIILWDKNNNNPKGEFDVMGHKKIAYTNWANDTIEPELKNQRLNEAFQIQEEILLFNRTKLSYRQKP
jgi:hypothetical protein